METARSQKSIWSLIAVVVLVFDFFPVKGETSENLTSSYVQMAAYFTNIGSIALPQMD